MDSGFSQIFSSMVEIFGMVYTTGISLYNWLSTPLSISAAGYVDYLGDLAQYTPFQIIFGPGLFIILVLCLVKFVLGILK